MKKFLKYLIKYVVIALLVPIVVVIFQTHKNDGIWGFNVKYLLGTMPLLITFFALGILLVVDLLRVLDGKNKKNNASKAIDKVKDDKGRDTKEFFSRDFVSEKELKDNKAYNYNTLQSLHNCKNDGVLVRAQQRGHTLDINFVKPIHTLVVGTTSSGKTTRFVEPTLQLMCMTASKPSFVIADPKGELYDFNAKKMEKEGYRVLTLDLRDPFASVQWNPLAYPWDLYQESFSLHDEVKVHPPGDNPNNYNLVKETSFDFANTSWYEFKGAAYVNKDKLENDIEVRSRMMQDDAYNALNDIATTIAPVESTKDPTWEQTAQKLIHAVMLAMLEDSRVPELGLTKEKYNPYNMYRICNTTDSGRDTFATIRKYLCDYRDKFSKVPILASPALKNADNTSKNYMGFVSQKTALFNDAAISFMTSSSEMDFINVDEQPTAIFIKYPDEIATRHPLLVLFINQLYKRLVEKAISLGGKLKRNVYFLLDEFAQMPKFPNFGSMMSVGRSRGCYFLLVVQSYSQLYQKYGQDEGKIIKDNCPIQVYVATEDMQTNKDFSELIGKKTITKPSENKSVGPDGKESKSYSDQTTSRPLLYPEELMTMRDEGKLIIKSFTPNAVLKTVIELSDKCKLYDRERIFGTYVQRRKFNEEAVFYDIVERNKFVEKQSGDDDDDDDLF